MVGYPIGGDTISVTSGVVSRIEVTSYVHGSTELLGIQIDAAINSGNSGAHPCMKPCRCLAHMTFTCNHHDCCYSDSGTDRRLAASLKHPSLCPEAVSFFPVGQVKLGSMRQARCV